MYLPYPRNFFTVLFVNSTPCCEVIRLDSKAYQTALEAITGKMETVMINPYRKEITALGKTQDARIAGVEMR